MLRHKVQVKLTKRTESHLHPTARRDIAVEMTSIYFVIYLPGTSVRGETEHELTKVGNILQLLLQRYLIETFTDRKLAVDALLRDVKVLDVEESLLPDTLK